MVTDESMRKLKCKKCGSRLKYPERLEKHQEIAHNKKNAEHVVKNLIHLKLLENIRKFAREKCDIPNANKINYRQ